MTEESNNVLFEKRGGFQKVCLDQIGVNGHVVKLPVLWHANDPTVVACLIEE